jgi:hypothetical protein
MQFGQWPQKPAARPHNAPRLRVRDDEPWMYPMHAATSSLDNTATAAPSRLPVRRRRRRVLRRAAWLTVDVAAIAACAVVFLHALT